MKIAGFTAFLACVGCVGEMPRGMDSKVTASPPMTTTGDGKGNAPAAQTTGTSSPPASTTSTLLAPVNTSESLTALYTPVWTWRSGGGGNGSFRVSIDDATMRSPQVLQKASYSPTSVLTLGLHTLYVQELDGAGNGSPVTPLRLRIVAVDPRMASALGGQCIIKAGRVTCDSSTAEPFADSNSIIVRGSYYSVCRLRDNGAVDYFGSAYTVPGRPAPQPGEPNVIDIACVKQGLLAMLDDGTVWQSEIGTSADMGTNITTLSFALQGGEHVVSVLDDDPVISVISNTGAVYFWGVPQADNSFGILSAADPNIITGMFVLSSGVTSVLSSGGVSSPQVILPAGRTVKSMSSVSLVPTICFLMDDGSTLNYRLPSDGSIVPPLANTPVLPAGRSVRGINALNTTCCLRLEDDSTVCN